MTRSTRHKISADSAKKDVVRTHKGHPLFYCLLFYWLAPPLFILPVIRICEVLLYCKLAGCYVQAYYCSNTLCSTDKKTSQKCTSVHNAPLWRKLHLSTCTSLQNTHLWKMDLSTKHTSQKMHLFTKCTSLKKIAPPIFFFKTHLCIKKGSTYFF